MFVAPRTDDAVSVATDRISKRAVCSEPAHDIQARELHVLLVFAHVLSWHGWIGTACSLALRRDVVPNGLRRDGTPSRWHIDRRQTLRSTLAMRALAIDRAVHAPDATWVAHGRVELHGLGRPLLFHEPVEVGEHIPAQLVSGDVASIDDVRAVAADSNRRHRPVVDVVHAQREQPRLLERFLHLFVRAVVPLRAHRIEVEQQACVPGH